MKTLKEYRKKHAILESYGYNLKETIGTGSYATVKLASSDRYSENVAIKIINKFSASSDYLRKFLPRELRIIKVIRHPNIVRFLQAIETTHKVYIIMEYIENGNLLDCIQTNSYINENQSKEWFRQLVSAIEYCHNLGIVHRDIKCENLLLTDQNAIKLIDFGFARNNLQMQNGQTLYSCTFCGSYAYASPEILKGIPYQPQYSDIWSMGVVLFAMVYGRLPFNDANYNNLIKLVCSKLVFPKVPEVSAPCRSLITKILAPIQTRIKIDAIKNDKWMTTANIL